MVGYIYLHFVGMYVHLILNNYTFINDVYFLLHTLFSLNLSPLLLAPCILMPSLFSIVFSQKNVKRFSIS